MKAVSAPLPKGSLAQAGDREMLTSLGCPTGTGVGLRFGADHGLVEEPLHQL